MNRRLFVKTTAIAAAILSASLSPSLGVAQAADKAKAAFVYVGPVGDHGWTYRHDEGRKSLEAALGDKVETVAVESVKEGPDAERVVRQLAADGATIIFTTSFGFGNATQKVAKQFPNIKFEHATGYKRGANISTYSGRFYEGRYVAGKIAGMMTKSNTIGYIASFPIPEVIRGINAFTLALRSVNPKARVKVAWVNTWYDPGKEADAAKALIDQGADILLQHTDSPAPLQVAEERGVLGFGQASDMSKFAPKAQLTAIIDNWGPYYIERTKASMDGSWTSEDAWVGLKGGMVELAPWGPAMPADVIRLAEETRDGIINGSIHPFQGPVLEQVGGEVVAPGAILGEQILRSMNWYVQGVDGKIPN